MAAPVSNIEDEVVVISDGDEEVRVSKGSGLVKGTKGNVGSDRQRAGRFMQWIPRVVSPMLHWVQSWEVGNQAVFRLEEQIKLVDRSGAMLKGTVCGEVSSTGAMGRAYVSLDFWQSDNGEGSSGCDTSHASSGHGVQASHQQLVRLAGKQRLPVKVRAPSEHRPEGRVQPGAVYPTSRETSGVEPFGPQIDSENARPSTSQGAGVGWMCMEEDVLDYEDDVEDPVMSLQWVVMAGDVPGVVQGGHSRVHRREMVAGNLPTGEEGLLFSVGPNELHEMMWGSIRRGALNFKGGLNERRMSKVDASI
ncbi:hypothetical protein NDU88_001847 [Pleurodeles waltl]|uniref:Uncharacterized protein n=1 Tax=Pleurodeles waltl TaxID=8319 RepID=A0AAV7SDB2_PLEWA|nr:hypothetical protein NDU88_001847 [Pleurodeles waltl]